MIKFLNNDLEDINEVIRLVAMKKSLPETIIVYTFFFASDLVDGVVWENVNLGTEEERKKQINCFEIALKLAELI